MIQFIKSIFASKKVSTVSVPNQVLAIEEKPILEYYLAELRKCKYIKPERYGCVLKHLTHEESLIKTGTTLTIEEKKALGINTRLSITKELLEVLTPEGLALSNPKALLEKIYNKATITKLRDDGFAKSIKAGIKKFTLCESGDGSECQWCKENIGLEHGSYLLQLMRENCKCEPYSKCFINPVIEL